MQQGYNLVLKSISTVIIVVIFIIFVLPGFPFNIRAPVYHLFRYAANVYLDYQTRDYLSLESKNFILKYAPKDAELAEFVLNTAEEFMAKVSKAMNYQQRGGKIRVVIYPDQELLNNSFSLNGDKSAVGVYWAGGIMLLSPAAWAAGEGTLEEIKETFYREGPLSHELTHLLVDRQTGGNYTRWLTEGLAQYIEREITGFSLEEPSAEEKELLYPLSSLDRDFDNRSNQILAYWQALQAVDFMITEYGMEKMRELVSLLGQGHDFGKSIHKVYGKPLHVLEQEIWDEVLAGRV